MQRLDRHGGLGGRESRGYKGVEAGRRGSEGAVGLCTSILRLQEPGLDSPRRAILGVVVRHHSAARVSVMGIVSSTAAGNPCPVLSRTAWRRCDSYLVGHSAVSSRRSADVAGVVGCDMLSEKSVKAAVMGLMPRRP